MVGSTSCVLASHVVFPETINVSAMPGCRSGNVCWKSNVLATKEHSDQPHYTHTVLVHCVFVPLAFFSFLLFLLGINVQRQRGNALMPVNMKCPLVPCQQATVT